MIVQWATLLTLLMWPLLVVLYFRLAKQEEKEMEAKFGEKYQEYKKKVPMMIPRLKREWRSATTDTSNKNNGELNESQSLDAESR